MGAGLGGGIRPRGVRDDRRDHECTGGDAADGHTDGERRHQHGAQDR